MPNGTSWLLDVPAQEVYISGTLVTPTVRQWEFEGITASYNTSTKRMVLTVSASGEWKDSVRLATDAGIAAHAFAGGTITFNAVGNQTVDGVSTQLADRILVKDEAATHLEHGIYEVTTLGTGAVQEVWERTSDADETGEITPQMRVAVQAGTANTGTVWYLSSPASGTVTVNTTAIGFSQQSAGDNVTVNGNACTDVDLDDASPAAVSGTNVLWQYTGSGPTSVSAYVPAASTTVIGALELATQGELDTGTDSTRAVTSNIIAAAAHLYHDNVAGEIHGDTLKGTPVGADEILIEDSAASWAKKRCTLTSVFSALGGGSVGGTGTDNHIARWDASTTDIQDSGVIISDADNVSGVASLAFGASPAGTGTIRLESTGSITWADSVSGDDTALSIDGSDNLTVGNSTSATTLKLRSAGSIEMWPSGVAGATVRFYSSNMNSGVPVLITASGYLELQERSVDPGGGSGATYSRVYAKDVGGASQLFFEDDTSAVTQITPSASATPAGGDLVWFVDIDDSNKRKSCTFTALGTAMSWGGGGLGGSTGSTDNAVLRADGTGGSTVQAGSAVYLLDAGAIAFGGTVANAGDIRGGTSTSWGGLNSSTTCTVVALSSGTVYLGDTNVEHVTVTTGASDQFAVVNGTTTELTINASVVSAKLPIEVNAGTVSTTGDIRLTKTGSIYYVKNATGNASLALIDGSDNITLGSSSSGGYVTVNAGGGIFFKPNGGSDVLELSSTLNTSYVPLAVNAGTVATAGDIRMTATGSIRMYKATTDITALDCSALYDVRLATGGSGVNVGFFGSPTTYDSGVGIVYLKNRTTAPTGDPDGGGYLYSDSGKATWRGTSGTTTTMAAA